MNPPLPCRRADLERIAKDVMRTRGLEPEFPAAVEVELRGLTRPAYPRGSGWRDLTGLPWCSIDNDDSRDLDQLSVTDTREDGTTRVLVAVADVDALVHRGCAIDDHAAHNTTSVYTAARVFPMLPEKLCTDLTSLNPGEDRLALVVEFTVGGDGWVDDEDVYQAMVRNRAKLAYPSVGAWLGGDGPQPDAVDEIIAAQLRAQVEIAQTLERRRFERGALEFDTIEPLPVLEDERVVGFSSRPHNAATKLIENFMIAANGVTARFLRRQGSLALRRVVRRPKHWRGIVELAADLGEDLPPQPDSIALQEFLVEQRRRNPVGFPDLSLSVIKLLGRGEYVVERVDGSGPGHFGLAVRDYAHSTAPNRRFPDLITHRLLKSVLDGADSPYSDDGLDELAAHCTRQEDAAEKVERHLRKSAAAFFLCERVGETFDAVVTGVSKGRCWIRVFDPPVEGRLVVDGRGLRVGKRVRAQLVSTDPEHGYLDFERP